MKRSILLAVTLVCSVRLAPAQRPDATATPRTTAAPKTEVQPKFKAIWEPVNYNEDLQLTDVYFVNDLVGWVSGAAGTVLKTTDGGDTWTAQLGGDPQSKEPPIAKLRFVDEKHGWALQQNKLLRTTDAEDWEQIGSIENRWALVDYLFSSETNGVYIDGNQNVARIMHTRDAGRTWNEAFPTSACRTKAEIQGLVKEVSCTLMAMHLASANVGYAVGVFGGSAPDLLPVLKTEDGGANWKLSAVQGISPVYMNGWLQEVVFTDESTGLLFLYAHQSGRLYATKDGGQTWGGVVGSAGPIIRFAGSDIGWAFDHYSYGNTYSLRYTTDSGKRWSSREFSFPAQMNAFSFPRRDRAYLVGDHGMIYRYRIVPVEYTAKGMIDAPMMPAANR